MKKKLVLGLVVLSMTAAQTSFAAGAVAAKSPREMVTKYSEMVRTAVLGKGGAKNLDGAKLEAAKQRVIEKLNTSKSTELSSALSGEAGKARIETLTTILAVKMASSNLAKSDAAEAQSMNAAADASIKLIANSQLVGAIKVRDFNATTQEGLTATEVTLVRETLAKLESMPADIIMQFNKAERDSYTQVFEKLDAITDGKISYEESFVIAIMQAKNVTREKALEMIQRLKKCSA